MNTYCPNCGTVNEMTSVRCVHCEAELAPTGGSPAPADALQEPPRPQVAQWPAPPPSDAPLGEPPDANYGQTYRRKQCLTAWPWLDFIIGFLGLCLVETLIGLTSGSLFIHYCLCALGLVAFVASFRYKYIVIGAVMGIVANIVLILGVLVLCFVSVLHPSH